MSRKINRVGERFVNNSGCEFEIIEYNKYTDLWIKFLDKHGAKVHTTYNNCLKGKVKNPYSPSVNGVGYLGLTKDGEKPKASVDGMDSREYKVWHSMLDRCYSNKYLEKQPSYIGCEVCERWLCFANFLEDLPLIEGYEYWLAHPNERVALDKDIKGNDSKIYCLENCRFVSISENSYEVLDRCGSAFGDSIKIYGVHTKTKEKTKIFNSIGEAKRELNICASDICYCLQGKYNSAGGYKWYRID